MKQWARTARRLVWLTQFGLSVALPLAGFVVAGVWLQRRFALGGWAALLGVALGVLGAAGGLVSSLRAMRRESEREEESAGHTETPAGFNRH